jgi:hypothetical protein
MRKIKLGLRMSSERVFDKNNTHTLQKSNVREQQSQSSHVPEE